MSLVKLILIVFHGVANSSIVKSDNDNERNSESNGDNDCKSNNDSKS